MRAPLLLAAAAAVRLAGAQRSRVVDDCRARLPPGTSFNEIEGQSGETTVHTLLPTTPGVLFSAPCPGFDLSVQAKHVR